MAHPQPKSGYAYVLKHSDAARSGSWSTSSNNDDWDVAVITPRHTSNYMWVGRRHVDGAEVNVWDDAHGRRYIAQTTAMTGRLLENAVSPWVPWAVGAGVLAAWWLLSSKASGSGKSCPVDVNKLNTWLIEKQLAGICAPQLSAAPTTYADLVKLKLAPPEFVPYVLVLSDGSFWYYSNPSATGAKSENLRKQFDSFGGSLSGHPGNLFLVI